MRVKHDAWSGDRKRTMKSAVREVGAFVWTEGLMVTVFRKATAGKWLEKFPFGRLVI